MTRRSKKAMKIYAVIFIGNILNVFIGNYIINAEKLSRLVYEMTPTELIKKEGYKVEEHNVITEDGYILTLHRIVGKNGSTPVFLQHGILISSFEWLISGKDNSLGFVLADHGYDVWLGNARGNIYSRRHIKYNPSERKFWDFSWHEMGVYDLPAVINYITNVKNESLIYVGHSMGTTMFFVMASEKPEMAAKVKVMFALAPVAFFHHTNNPVSVFHSAVDSLKTLLESFGMYELFPPEIRKLMHNFAKEYCCKNELLNESNICSQVINLIAAGDASRFNYTALPLLVSHAPEGISLKTGLHYLQEMGDGYFKKYNYDKAKNLRMYGSYDPPHYNISRIQVPVGIFWANKDAYFAHPLDVKKFYDLLPNKILNYEVPNTEYTHMDFIIGIDSSKYVFPKLLSVMKDYR